MKLRSFVIAAVLGLSLALPSAAVYAQGSGRSAAEAQGFSAPRLGQISEILSVSPMMGTAGEANWGGITGTAFWLDPGQKVAVVFLTQAPATRSHYRPMRRAMIYGAMIR